MANKKQTVLDNLVAEILGLGVVTTSTRTLLGPADARKHSPYVGLISGTEETIVEDATDIRYELDVNLILLKRGRDVEEMLDGLKILLFTDSLAATIGAFQVKVIGQEEVAIVDEDKYSSTRIVLVITYLSTKGVF